MPLLFTSSWMSVDKNNDPLNKRVVEMTETLTFRNKLTLFAILWYTGRFASLTESRFHCSMLENTGSTEPEVQLIARENRDPTNKNSFLKVWKERIRVIYFTLPTTTLYKSSRSSQNNRHFAHFAKFAESQLFARTWKWFMITFQCR